MYNPYEPPKPEIRYKRQWKRLDTPDIIFLIVCIIFTLAWPFALIGIIAKMVSE
jgi:hypothetical protein